MSRRLQDEGFPYIHRYTEYVVAEASHTRAYLYRHVWQCACMWRRALPFPDDLGGADNVFKHGLLDSRERSAPRSDFQSFAFEIERQNGALSQQDNVLLQLLLQLLDEPSLDSLHCLLIDCVRDEDDQSLLSSLRHVHLSRGTYYQIPYLSLQI